MAFLFWWQSVRRLGKNILKHTPLTIRLLWVRDGEEECKNKPLSSIQYSVSDGNTSLHWNRVRQQLPVHAGLQTANKDKFILQTSSFSIFLCFRFIFIFPFLRLVFLLLFFRYLLWFSFGLIDFLVYIVIIRLLQYIYKCVSWEYSRSIWPRGQRPAPSCSYLVTNLYKASGQVADYLLLCYQW